MKFCFLFFTIFFFASCSAEKPRQSDEERENIKARNEEIALKNELSDITLNAQKLEKKGRAMEIFRQANNAQNDRECAAAMEEAQKETNELDARIAKLPDIYKKPLAPVIPDLTDCVSCSKTAMESCVKARASINKAIKDLYP